MGFCQTCGTALPNNGAACAICARRDADNATAPAVSDTINSGLQPNAAAALTYAIGLVTGVLFLMIDPYKSDKYVRFHAYQSIFFNIAWIGFWIVWIVAGLILGAMTKSFLFLLELPVNLLLIVGGLILWILLMYRAYQGRYFSLPFIGTIAADKADA